MGDGTVYYAQHRPTGRDHGKGLVHKRGRGGGGDKVARIINNLTTASSSLWSFMYKGFLSEVHPNWEKSKKFFLV
jgi:hypothetical protein